MLVLFERKKIQFITFYFKLKNVYLKSNLHHQNKN